MQISCLDCQQEEHDFSGDICPVPKPTSVVRFHSVLGSSHDPVTDWPG